MGIKDLLKFMKPYIEPIHIKKYAGKRVGIDAYSWLHKGAYSCSLELCLNSDSEKKLRYIDYFMHRINLLRHHKITPVVVFDGGNLPSKAATEQDRHRRRITNRDLAMAKLKEGNVSAASEFFQRAVSITPYMAHQLIQILRSENIEFVVAPYEADAQLAYMSSLEAEQGGISAVITEDSDLIAYGCKAIVFKMDRYGNGEEILIDNVFDSKARTPSFQNFDKELFTGMCILAGCDFLPSVPGIGIAKSYAFVSKYRNLDRVLSVLKLEKGAQMSEDYPKSFREAVAVFQHAQIYDADMKKLKHMRPIPVNLLQSLDGELDFLGPGGLSEVPASIATAIAEGNLDPISTEAFDRFPSSKCHPGPIRIQTSGHLPRVEAPVVSARESCFVVFSQKATENYNTEKQNTVSNKAKCTNKVEALEKLLVSSPIDETVETTVVTSNSPLKIPDNNPFKRKKLDQTQSNQRRDQVSEATHVEVLDSSNTISTDNISQKVPESVVASRKRKLEETTLCTSEQVSGVTQEENSEVLCLVSESQESVKSKVNKISGLVKKKISGGKRKGETGKLKDSSSNSSDTKKSTILNFFSRV